MTHPAGPQTYRVGDLRKSGTEPGAGVATYLPFDRPPSLHTLRRRLITGFVRGFTGTMQPSDSSSAPDRLRLLTFPIRPQRRTAAWGSWRSPRFRRDPFARDEVFDHGRATKPRMTAPLILPSTSLTASAPASICLSRLNSSPHTIAVYASDPPSPTNLQHSLSGARYGLPEPDFHRQDRASLPGAPEEQKICR